MEAKPQDVNEQLTHSFGYHKPDEATAKVLTEIRERSLEHAKWLASVLPPSRERSLAFTKLEESSMWAVKALVLRCPLG